MNPTLCNSVARPNTATPVVVIKSQIDNCKKIELAEKKSCLHPTFSAQSHFPKSIPRQVFVLKLRTICQPQIYII